jgi:outer membrane immunogenic protein
MNMRSIGLATILLLGAAASAVGQAIPSFYSGGGDAGLTYHWVRTNTLGSCGCFSLNGVGVSASWRFMPLLAVVGEASVDHTAAGPSGSSLTLTTYMVGARRIFPLRSSEEGPGLRTFGEVMVGLGHAGGGVAGPGDATNAFIGRMGGGLDLPLSPRFTLRVVQVDYLYTAFGNGDNNHQNNLLFGAGLVYQWFR